MADPKPANPFARLAALRNDLPPGDAPAPATPAPAAVAVDPVVALLARRVVVCHERKGRGGKTVTVLQFPDGGGGDEAAVDALARELRKALGTAAQREDATVAVQGDIVDRVVDWLGRRGAARIVRG